MCDVSELSPNATLGTVIFLYYIFNVRVSIFL